MTSFDLLEALTPDTVLLGVRVPTYKIWEDSAFHNRVYDKETPRWVFISLPFAVQR